MDKFIIHLTDLKGFQEKNTRIQCTFMALSVEYFGVFL